jgi:hypothetical protein
MFIFLTQQNVLDVCSVTQGHMFSKTASFRNATLKMSGVAGGAISFFQVLIPGKMCLVDTQKLGSFFQLRTSICKLDSLDLITDMQQH